MHLFQRTVHKRGSFSILFKIRLDKTFSVSKLWENDNGRWKQSFWSVNEVWTGSLPQDNRKKVNSPLLLAHCIHISYLIKPSSFTRHLLSQKSSPAARCNSVKILTFYLLKDIFNDRKRKQTLSVQYWNIIYRFFTATRTIEAPVRYSNFNLYNWIRVCLKLTI